MASETAHSMDKPEFGISLDNLELVTGIRLDHLQMMMNGECLPSEHHAKLLRKHLSNDEFRWMTRHSKPELNVVTSRIGSVPQGYRLIPYLPAKDLMPGDLIAHRDSSLGPGKSRWIRVVSVSNEGRVVVDVGSVYAHIDKSTALRVARAERAEIDGYRRDEEGEYSG